MEPSEVNLKVPFGWKIRVMEALAWLPAGLDILVEAFFAPIAAEARLLVSAETGSSVEQVMGVDPDGASFKTDCNFKRFWKRVRPYGRAQTVVCVVSEVDCFFRCSKSLIWSFFAFFRT